MTWRKSKIEWGGLLNCRHNLNFENQNLIINISTKYTEGDPRVFVFYEPFTNGFSMAYFEISLLHFNLIDEKDKENISLNDLKIIQSFLHTNQKKLLELWNEPDYTNVFLYQNYIKKLIPYKESVS